MTVVESQLGQLLFTENDIKNLLVLHKHYAKKTGTECFKNGTGELWIKNLVSFSKTYTKKSHIWSLQGTQILLTYKIQSIIHVVLRRHLTHVLKIQYIKDKKRDYCEELCKGELVVQDIAIQHGDYRPSSSLQPSA